MGGATEIPRSGSLRDHPQAGGRFLRPVDHQSRPIPPQPFRLTCHIEGINGLSIERRGTVEPIPLDL